jgi:hypothetical protein
MPLKIKQTIDGKVISKREPMPVSGRTRTVRGTLRGRVSGVIAAAGNYAALDVISQSATDGEGEAWEFADVARVGTGGLIIGASVSFSAQSMTARTRLWLFTDNPQSCELDDNAAFSLDIDDLDKRLPYIDFPALVDFGEVTFAQNISDRIGFQLPTDGSKLWGILQFVDAETNEAADMTATITLHILED